MPGVPGAKAIVTIGSPKLIPGRGPFTDAGLRCQFSDLLAIPRRKIDFCFPIHHGGSFLLKGAKVATSKGRFKRIAEWIGKATVGLSGSHRKTIA